MHLTGASRLLPVTSAKRIMVSIPSLRNASPRIYLRHENKLTAMYSMFDCLLHFVPCLSLFPLGRVAVFIIAFDIFLLESIYAFQETS